MSSLRSHRIRRLAAAAGVGAILAFGPTGIAYAEDTDSGSDSSSGSSNAQSSTGATTTSTGTETTSTGNSTNPSSNSTNTSSSSTSTSSSSTNTSSSGNGTDSGSGTSTTHSTNTHTSTGSTGTVSGNGLPSRTEPDTQDTGSDRSTASSTTSNTDSADPTTSNVPAQTAVESTSSASTEPVQFPEQRHTEPESQTFSTATEHAAETAGAESDSAASETTTNTSTSARTTSRTEALSTTSHTATLTTTSSVEALTTTPHSDALAATVQDDTFEAALTTSPGVGARTIAASTPDLTISTTLTLPDIQVSLVPPQQLAAAPALGLFFFIGFTPGSPTSPLAVPPTMWALTWFVRRIDNFLFNDTPIANPVATGTQDPTNGTVTGNLGATDSNGDALTYRVIGDPSRGSVSVASDGSYTYVPNSDLADQGGTDTFRVEIRDDTNLHVHGLRSLLYVLGLTSHNPHVAVVDVTVGITSINEAPVVGGPAAVGSPDPNTGAVTIDTKITDPDGDKLKFTTSGNGSLSTNPDGTVTYTPTSEDRHAAAAPGADQYERITISASDDQHPPVVVAVDIPLLPLNSDPTLVSQNRSVGKGGVVNGTVLFQDSDGDALTYGAGGTDQYGTLTVDQDGTFTYVPTETARHQSAAQPIQHIITITVTDGHGGTASQDVTFAILESNVEPTVSLGTQSTGANGTITGSVVATDADNDALTYTGSTTTSKGTVVVNPDGTYTYTPTEAARVAASQAGATSAATKDSFTVTVDDGHGGTPTIDVEVDIAKITRVEATAVNVEGTQTTRSDGTTVVAGRNVVTNENWVIVTHPDGSQTTTKMSSTGQIAGNPVITANGTVYVTTESGGSVTVNKINPDGTEAASPGTYTGNAAGGPVLGGDGLVYQTINNSGATTTVVGYRPDGSVRTFTVNDHSTAGPTVTAGATPGADGTVYQAIDAPNPNGSRATAVWRVDSDGTKTWMGSNLGETVGSPYVAANGTVYQTLNRPGDGVFVTRYTPNGNGGYTIIANQLIGFTALSGPVVDANGRRYQTVRTGVNADTYHTRVISFATDLENVIVRGTPAGDLVMVDGVAYQTIDTSTPTTPQTTVVSLHADGTSDRVTFAGRPQGGVSVTDDGVLHQAVYVEGEGTTVYGIDSHVLGNTSSTDV